MYLERDKKTQREREREKIKKVKKGDARTDLASAHDACYHRSSDDRDASKMLSFQTQQKRLLFCVCVSKTKKKKKKKKKKKNNAKKIKIERERERKKKLD